MAICPHCQSRFDDELTECPNDGVALVPDEVFATVDSPLVAGDMVGEYRITGELGRGSFGDVYASEHPLIGKMAAVKVLKRQFTSDPEVISRFISEARAVNKIRNRNIIDIFAFGTLPGGRQYFVMELLEGETLQEFLKTNRVMAVEDALPILGSIARALDAAHEAGIAHRDLKPENVFLCFEKDGSCYPKLLDFGIAKLLADDFTGHQTRTGAAMGTPLYMSPEQCRARDVDHRADIYAFGCLAHRMLTGSVLFSGESVMDVLIKHTTQPAPTMSSVNPELNAALDAPVTRMLEKVPDERPNTTGEGFRALRQAAMDAGYAVGADTLGAPSSIQRSGEVSGIRSMPVPSGVSATAAGDKTELDASGQGSGVLSVQAPPAQSRGKWVAFAAGIALVAGAGYVFTKPDATPAPSTPSVADTPKPKPQEPTATPSEASAAAPSASAAPASTVVKLDVSTTPPGADIHEGETKLGQAGTPMTLPRGDAPLTLRVTKSGFQPGSITVTPSKDLSVSVTLVAAVKKPIMRGKPAAAPVKPVRPHSDLEGLD